VRFAIGTALHAPRTTPRLFNELYYLYSKLRRCLRVSDNDELFLHYNFDASFTVPPAATMCGPRGYTIQVSVPRNGAADAIHELIEICQRAPCPPVTTILRVHRRDEHTISFSEDGYSLNFELHPKRRHEARMRPHVDALVDCVLRHRGRVHLAKDSILSAEQFRGLYPEHADFLRIKRRLDPNDLFVSDAWRRLFHGATSPHAPAPAPTWPIDELVPAGEAPSVALHRSRIGET
jgi:FAD/FMN-containing dehydrogenase